MVVLFMSSYSSYIVSQLYTGNCQSQVFKLIRLQQHGTEAYIQFRVTVISPVTICLSLLNTWLVYEALYRKWASKPIKFNSLLNLEMLFLVLGDSIWHAIANYTMANININFTQCHVCYQYILPDLMLCVWHTLLYDNGHTKKCMHICYVYTEWLCCHSTLFLVVIIQEW